MKRIFKSKKQWLKNRKIGGTDLATVINGVGRWQSVGDLYDRLVNGKVENKKETQAMANGRLAESHIIALFLTQTPHLRPIRHGQGYLLITNQNEPYLTLSPDCLVKDTQSKQRGFIEIKLKQIYSENQIANYLGNLKEEEPQYYWQLIHYFIVEKSLQFGYLVVAFQIKRKEGETWQNDKIIIDSLKVNRQDVQDDINTAKAKLKDFINNNVIKHVRPSVKVENQKESKIEWSKLSNIAILNQ